MEREEWGWGNLKYFKRSQKTYFRRRYGTRELNKIRNRELRKEKDSEHKEIRAKALNATC